MAHHVGASFVSLAPIFYKNQSALAPLLLLSKPDPLWLGSGLVFGERYKSCIATRTTSEQALYRLLRLFSKVRARLRRCSSFPNRTRCRWAPVWFFCCIAKSALLRLFFFLPAASKKPYARAFVLPFPQKVTLRRNKLRAFQFFGMIVLSKKARLLRGGFSFL